MTTNSRKEANRRNQAAYKERMRKAGYDQFTVWIQPERKEILNRLSTKLREADEVTLLLISNFALQLENRA